MRPTKNVANTAKNEVNPQWLGGGNPNAILDQEARGQESLVKSDSLPTHGIEDVRPMIESAGGSIGSPVIGDDVFTVVTLPNGWSKERTDHSMWSDLLDSAGRKRAAIFYKASFYDRSARISTCCRFGVDAYSHEVEGEVKAVLTDACGEEEFSTAVIKYGERSDQYESRRTAAAEVEAFLDKSYPKWKDANSYWD